MLTHDQPALLVAHPASFFCMLPFFCSSVFWFFFPPRAWFWHCVVASLSLKALSIIGWLRNWRCSGGGVLLPLLHCILPCIRQGSSRGPCSGTWLFVDLRHWQLIPPDNTQITFAISEVTKWNVFLQSMLIRKKIPVPPPMKNQKKKESLKFKHFHW